MGWIRDDALAEGGWESVIVPATLPLTSDYRPEVAADNPGGAEAIDFRRAMK